MYIYVLNRGKDYHSLPRRYLIRYKSCFMNSLVRRCWTRFRNWFEIRDISQLIITQLFICKLGLHLIQDFLLLWRNSEVFFKGGLHSDFQARSGPNRYCQNYYGTYREKKGALHFWKSTKNCWWIWKKLRKMSRQVNAKSNLTCLH